MVRQYTHVNSTGIDDILIVNNCALQIAMDGQEVNVVADNTDGLILLMHHMERQHGRCAYSF